MKNLLLFLSLLFVCLKGSSQAPTEKATLWQVSGPGLSHPSYLFGTFHLLCPEDLIISNTLTSKLGDCKKLFLELDFSDPQINEKMVRSMSMRGDSTFHDLYDSITYAEVNKRLIQITHLSLDMLSSMKPFGLSSVVMMSTLNCQPASWELKLAEMAKEKELEIAGLETVEDQASVFDTIPYALQAAQLKETLFHLDSSRTEIHRLIQLYQDQDIPKLFEQSIQDTLMRSYLDILLYRRNAGWIPTILQEAKTKPTFFAFGAGHLGGEKGVISLLRKAGYIVKPLAQEYP